VINITRGSGAKYAEAFAEVGFKMVPGGDRPSLMEVKTIADPDDREGCLVLCCNALRRQKEAAMLSRTELRFLTDLAALRQRLEKARLKETVKIERAIGRLQKKYPRVPVFILCVMPMASCMRLATKSALLKPLNCWATTCSKPMARSVPLNLAAFHGFASSRESLCLPQRHHEFAPQLSLTRPLRRSPQVLMPSPAGSGTLRAACGRLSQGLSQFLSQGSPAFSAYLRAGYHLWTWIRQTLRAGGDTRDWKTLRRLLFTHSLLTTVLPLRDGRVVLIRKA